MEFKSIYADSAGKMSPESNQSALHDQLSKIEQRDTELWNLDIICTKKYTRTVTRRKAKELFRAFKKASKSERRSPAFIRGARMKLAVLRLYNNSVLLKKERYPRTKWMFHLLCQYVALEFEGLQPNAGPSNCEAEFVTSMLENILSNYFDVDSEIRSKVFIVYIIVSAYQTYKFPKWYMDTLTGLVLKGTVIQKQLNDVYSEDDDLIYVGNIWSNDHLKYFLEMDDFATDDEDSDISDQEESNDLLNSMHRKNRRKLEKLSSTTRLKFPLEENKDEEDDDDVIIIKDEKDTSDCDSTREFNCDSPVCDGSSKQGGTRGNNNQSSGGSIQKCDNSCGTQYNSRLCCNIITIEDDDDDVPNKIDEPVDSDVEVIYCDKLISPMRSDRTKNRVRRKLRTKFSRSVNSPDIKKSPIPIYIDDEYELPPHNNYPLSNAVSPKSNNKSFGQTNKDQVLTTPHITGDQSVTKLIPTKNTIDEKSNNSNVCKDSLISSKLKYFGIDQNDDFLKELQELTVESSADQGKNKILNLNSSEVKHTSTNLESETSEPPTVIPDSFPLAEVSSTQTIINDENDISTEISTKNTKDQLIDIQIKKMQFSGVEESISKTMNIYSKTIVKDVLDIQLVDDKIEQSNIEINVTNESIEHGEVIHLDTEVLNSKTINRVNTESTMNTGVLDVQLLDDKTRQSNIDINITNDCIEHGEIIHSESDVLNSMSKATNNLHTKTIVPNTGELDIQSVGDKTGQSNIEINRAHDCIEHREIIQSEDEVLKDPDGVRVMEDSVHILPIGDDNNKPTKTIENLEVSSVNKTSSIEMEPILDCIEHGEENVCSSEIKAIQDLVPVHSSLIVTSKNISHKVITGSINCEEMSLENDAVKDPQLDPVMEVRSSLTVAYTTPKKFVSTCDTVMKNIETQMHSADKQMGQFNDTVVPNDFIKHVENERESEVEKLDHSAIPIMDSGKLTVNQVELQIRNSDSEMEEVKDSIEEINPDAVYIRSAITTKEKNCVPKENAKIQQPIDKQIDQFYNDYIQSKCDNIKCLDEIPENGNFLTEPLVHVLDVSKDESNIHTENIMKTPEFQDPPVETQVGKSDIDVNLNKDSTEYREKQIQCSDVEAVKDQVTVTECETIDSVIIPITPKDGGCSSKETFLKNTVIHDILLNTQIDIEMEKSVKKREKIIQSSEIKEIKDTTKTMTCSTVISEMCIKAKENLDVNLPEKCIGVTTMHSVTKTSVNVIETKSNECENDQLNMQKEVEDGEDKQFPKISIQKDNEENAFNKYENLIEVNKNKTIVENLTVNEISIPFTESKIHNSDSNLVDTSKCDQETISMNEKKLKELPNNPSNNVLNEQSKGHNPISTDCQPSEEIIDPLEYLSGNSKDNSKISKDSEIPLTISNEEIDDKYVKIEGSPNNSIKLGTNNTLKSQEDDIISQKCQEPQVKSDAASHNNSNMKQDCCIKNCALQSGDLPQPTVQEKLCNNSDLVNNSTEFKRDAQENTDTKIDTINTKEEYFKLKCKENQSINLKSIATVEEEEVENSLSTFNEEFKNKEETYFDKLKTTSELQIGGKYLESKDELNTGISCSSNENKIETNRLHSEDISKLLDKESKKDEICHNDKQQDEKEKPLIKDNISESQLVADVKQINKLSHVNTSPLITDEPEIFEKEDKVDNLIIKTSKINDIVVNDESILNSHPVTPLLSNRKQIIDTNLETIAPVSADVIITQERIIEDINLLATTLQAGHIEETNILRNQDVITSKNELVENELDKSLTKRESAEHVQTVDIVYAENMCKSMGVITEEMSINKQISVTASESQPHFEGYEKSDYDKINQLEAKETSKCLLQNEQLYEQETNTGSKTVFDEKCVTTEIVAETQRKTLKLKINEITDLQPIDIKLVDKKQTAKGVITEELKTNKEICDNILTFESQLQAENVLSEKCNNEEVKRNLCEKVEKSFTSNNYVIRENIHEVSEEKRCVLSNETIITHQCFDNDVSSKNQLDGNMDAAKDDFINESLINNSVNDLHDTSIVSDKKINCSNDRTDLNIIENKPYENLKIEHAQQNLLITDIPTFENDDINKKSTQIFSHESLNSTERIVFESENLINGDVEITVQNTEVVSNNCMTPDVAHKTSVNDVPSLEVKEADIMVNEGIGVSLQNVENIPYEDTEISVTSEHVTMKEEQVSNEVFTLDEKKDVNIKEESCNLEKIPDPNSSHLLSDDNKFAWELLQCNMRVLCDAAEKKIQESRSRFKLSSTKQKESETVMKKKNKNHKKIKSTASSHKPMTRSCSKSQSKNIRGEKNITDVEQNENLKPLQSLESDLKKKSISTGKNVGGRKVKNAVPKNLNIDQNAADVKEICKIETVKPKGSKPTKKKKSIGKLKEKNNASKNKKKPNIINKNLKVLISNDDSSDSFEGKLIIPDEPTLIDFSTMSKKKAPEIQKNEVIPTKMMCEMDIQPEPVPSLAEAVNQSSVFQDVSKLLDDKKNQTSSNDDNMLGNMKSKEGTNDKVNVRTKAQMKAFPEGNRIDNNVECTSLISTTEEKDISSLPYSVNNLLKENINAEEYHLSDDITIKSAVILEKDINVENPDDRLTSCKSNIKTPKKLLEILNKSEINAQKYETPETYPMTTIQPMVSKEEEVVDDNRLSEQNSKDVSLVAKINDKLQEDNAKNENFDKNQANFKENVNIENRSTANISMLENNINVEMLTVIDKNRDQSQKQTTTQDNCEDLINMPIEVHSGMQPIIEHKDILNHPNVTISAKEIDATEVLSSATNCILEQSKKETTTEKSKIKSISIDVPSTAKECAPESQNQTPNEKDQSKKKGRKITMDIKTTKALKTSEKTDITIMNDTFPISCSTDKQVQDELVNIKDTHKKPSKKSKFSKSKQLDKDNQHTKESQSNKLNNITEHTNLKKDTVDYTCQTSEKEELRSFGRSLRSSRSKQNQNVPIVLENNSIKSQKIFLNEVENVGKNQTITERDINQKSVSPEIAEIDRKNTKKSSKSSDHKLKSLPIVSKNDNEKHINTSIPEKTKSKPSSHTIKTNSDKAKVEYFLKKGEDIQKNIIEKQITNFQPKVILEDINKLSLGDLTKVDSSKFEKLLKLNSADRNNRSSSRSSKSNEDIPQLSKDDKRKNRSSRSSKSTDTLEKEKSYTSRTDKEGDKKKSDRKRDRSKTSKSDPDKYVKGSSASPKSKESSDKKSNYKLTKENVENLKDKQVDKEKKMVKEIIDTKSKQKKQHKPSAKNKNSESAAHISNKLSEKNIQKPPIEESNTSFNVESKINKVSLDIQDLNKEKVLLEKATDKKPKYINENINSNESKTSKTVNTNICEEEKIKKDGSFTIELPIEKETEETNDQNDKSKSAKKPFKITTSKPNLENPSVVKLNIVEDFKSCTSKSSEDNQSKELKKSTKLAGDSELMEDGGSQKSEVLKSVPEKKSTNIADETTIHLEKDSTKSINSLAEKNEVKLKIMDDFQSRKRKKDEDGQGKKSKKISKLAHGSELLEDVKSQEAEKQKSASKNNSVNFTVTTNVEKTPIKSISSSKNDNVAANITESEFENSKILLREDNSNMTYDTRKHEKKDTINVRKTTSTKSIICPSVEVPKVTSSTSKNCKNIGVDYHQSTTFLTNIDKVNSEKEQESKNVPWETNEVQQNEIKKLNVTETMECISHQETITNNTDLKVIEQKTFENISSELIGGINVYVSESKSTNITENAFENVKTDHFNPNMLQKQTNIENVPICTSSETKITAPIDQEIINDVIPDIIPTISLNSLGGISQEDNNEGQTKHNIDLVDLQKINQTNFTPVNLTMKLESTEKGTVNTKLDNHEIHAEKKLCSDNKRTFLKQKPKSTKSVNVKNRSKSIEDIINSKILKQERKECKPVTDIVKEDVKNKAEQEKQLEECVVPKEPNVIVETIPQFYDETYELNRLDSSSHVILGLVTAPEKIIEPVQLDEFLEEQVLISDDLSTPGSLNVTKADTPPLDYDETPLSEKVKKKGSLSTKALSGTQTAIVDVCLSEQVYMGLKPIVTEPLDNSPGDSDADYPFPEQDNTLGFLTEDDLIQDECLIDPNTNETMFIPNTCKEEIIEHEEKGVNYYTRDQQPNPQLSDDFINDNDNQIREEFSGPMSVEAMNQWMDNSLQAVENQPNFSSGSPKDSETTSDGFFNKQKHSFICTHTGFGDMMDGLNSNKDITWSQENIMEKKEPFVPDTIKEMFLNKGDLTEVHHTFPNRSLQTLGINPTVTENTYFSGLNKTKSTTPFEKYKLSTNETESTKSLRKSKSKPAQKIIGKVNLVNIQKLKQEIRDKCNINVCTSNLSKVFTETRKQVPPQSPIKHTQNMILDKVSVEPKNKMPYLEGPKSKKKAEKDVSLKQSGKKRELPQTETTHERPRKRLKSNIIDPEEVSNNFEQEIRKKPFDNRPFVSTEPDTRYARSPSVSRRHTPEASRSSKSTLYAVDFDKNKYHNEPSSSRGYMNNSGSSRRSTQPKSRYRRYEQDHIMNTRSQYNNSRFLNHVDSSMQIDNNRHRHYSDSPSNRVNSYNYYNSTNNRHSYNSSNVSRLHDWNRSESYLDAHHSSRRSEVSFPLSNFRVLNPRMQYQHQSWEDSKKT